MKIIVSRAAPSLLTVGSLPGVREAAETGDCDPAGHGLDELGACLRAVTPAKRRSAAVVPAPPDHAQDPS